MYIIVGAGGFLGSYIMRAVLDNTDDKILAVDQDINEKKNDSRIEWLACNIVNDDDIDKLNVKISLYEPVNIIYLAAYHHPDMVKKNPKLAWDINITSLSKFINKIENVRCFFYSSTEMVYGAGTRDTLFTEESRLSPVNIYGKHKVIAETITNGYCYNVVRFPFLIGPCITPGKKHFYDVILDTIRDGRPMEMFQDAYKSALDFGTASKILVRLVENYSDNIPKILNISGDEILSKYEIGLRIAKEHGCLEELIIPISLNEDNEIFTEKRADCTLLDNSLVKKVLKIDEIKLVL